MEDIKILIDVEGELTFKDNGKDCITYNKEGVRTGIYHANIKDIEKYCKDNNLKVNFIY